MMQRKKKSEYGFTLVELAISLVVIGLLIGGLLKGREMIVNARATKSATQLLAVDHAVMQFYSTYNAMPGDISVIAGVLPNCSALPCTAVGSGDNRLTTAGETSNFWRHLGRTGLLEGVDVAFAGDDQTRMSPLTAIGGRLRVEYNDRVTWGEVASTWQGNSLGFTEPREKNILMSLIDQKIDDGKPYTGEVRVESPTAGATDCVLATGEYSLVLYRSVSCHFLMRLKMR